MRRNYRRLILNYLLIAIIAFLIAVLSAEERRTFLLSNIPFPFNEKQFFKATPVSEQAPPADDFAVCIKFLSNHFEKHVKKTPAFLVSYWQENCRQLSELYSIPRTSHFLEFQLNIFQISLQSLPDNSVQSLSHV